MLFIPHDIFFTSRPNATIRAVKSEFCMTFIKFPEAGTKQLLAPQRANSEENGSSSLPRGRLGLSPPTCHSFESFASQLLWTWEQVTGLASEELSLDLNMTLFSLTSHVTSLALSFLVSKMGWVGSET